MNRHPVRCLMILALLCLAAACAPAALNLPPGEDTLEKIEAGMEEKTVRLLAGEPDRVVPTPYGARVLYYRESIVADCTKDLSTCLPIVVANGRVAAIGQQWMAAWQSEQKRQQNREIAAARQQKSDSPLRLNGAAADNQSSAATREQIARLENQVRRIPVSRTMDNLKIYRYLQKLDPGSAKYARKVAFYEAQLKRDQERRAEEKRLAAELRQRQNALLKNFEGNDRARIALENLGGGNFHVWVESRLKTALRIQPRHFTLVCTNGARFAVYQSKDLTDTIAPGKVIDGRLSFDAYCPPREMVFNHPATGRITRAFPPAPETPAP